MLRQLVMMAMAAILCTSAFFVGGHDARASEVQAEEKSLAQQLGVSPAALKLAEQAVPVQWLKSFLPGIAAQGREQLVAQLPTVTGSPQDVAEFVHKMKVVRESQQSVEGYQQRQEHLKQMALLMKRESWPLPEQQSANMVMCEENVSQLESGAQIAEAGEEDGKKLAELELFVENSSGKNTTPGTARVVFN